MNEIKVGDWTLTEAGLSRLNDLHAIAFNWQQKLDLFAVECCEILGIDAPPSVKVIRTEAMYLPSEGQSCS